ncbi:hypothetical protein ACFL0I_04995, partial [Gemmatimonadota bacterium]
MTPLRRVLLKHVKEVFSLAAGATDRWEELGYLRPPDPDRALEEHDALVELLQGFGTRVDLLPPNPATNLDSIYVRDASILT